MSGCERLRRLLTATAEEHNLPVKDLTVLAVQNDPFRIDTPAGHRDGEWLAINADRLGLVDRTIHLRGLHYVLVTDATPKPNGETYANTDADWKWLQERAADAARWLGYIPFDRIIDRRNAEPVVRVLDRDDPWPYLSVGISVDIPDAADLEPRVGVLDFTGVQPYRRAMIGEKSSLSGVLSPVAGRYGADLYLPTGEISDTHIHRIAKAAADDGRPMVVFYFSDADPAGWQMPISVGRKLQALKVGFYPDLEFAEYRVALTPDQVRTYDLPSTPLKKTEKRADAWTKATGLAQTEIDALASLRPDLLRQLAEDAIAPFYDATLNRRVRQAEREWIAQAQAVVDQGVDQQFLSRLRSDADEKLRALRSEIDAINHALRLDADDFDLPTPVVPTAELNGHVHGTPLLDSRWPFIDQTRRLIDCKAYRDIGGVRV